MKRYYIIILALGISIAIGIYAISVQYPFIPIRYTNLDLMGIKDTYNTGQEIKFQVKATGYGMPCGPPTITIYKSDQPSVIIYEKKSPPFMCPIEGPIFFNVVYPSQNDTHSVTINQDGKYTIRVSYLDKEIEKQFSVLKSQEQDKTIHTTGLQCGNKFMPIPPRTTALPNGTMLTINKVPVFLMKPNSVGKICIQYSLNDQPMRSLIQITVGVFTANHLATNDINITSTPTSVLLGSENKTVVYTITTDNYAKGFYGISPTYFNCIPLPFAVGYDSSHSFDNDFPWLWDTLPCPYNSANAKITGLSGIEVDYITKIY